VTAAARVSQRFVDRRLQAPRFPLAQSKVPSPHQGYSTGTPTASQPVALRAGLYREAAERIRTADPFITSASNGGFGGIASGYRVTLSPLGTWVSAAEHEALGDVHDLSVRERTGVSGPNGPKAHHPLLRVTLTAARSPLVRA